MVGLSSEIVENTKAVEHAITRWPVGQTIFFCVYRHFRPLRVNKSGKGPYVSRSVLFFIENLRFRASKLEEIRKIWCWVFVKNVRIFKYYFSTKIWLKNWSLKFGYHLFGIWSGINFFFSKYFILKFDIKIPISNIISSV